MQLAAGINKTVHPTLKYDRYESATVTLPHASVFATFICVCYRERAALYYTPSLQTLRIGPKLALEIESISVLSRWHALHAESNLTHCLRNWQILTALSAHLLLLITQLSSCLPPLLVLAHAWFDIAGKLCKLTIHWCYYWHHTSAWQELQELETYDKKLHWLWCTLQHSWNGHHGGMHPHKTRQPWPTQ